MTSKAALRAFHTWAREAPFGAEHAYHVEGSGPRDPDVFRYARKLSTAGLVFLYQQRLRSGLFAYVARRTPVAAHLVLDKVSAAIQGPVLNPTLTPEEV